MEADKRMAEMEKRGPNTYNFRHALKRIEDRKRTNDKTAYYGIVGTVKDLMKPLTQQELAANDRLLEAYGF